MEAIHTGAIQGTVACNSVNHINSGFYFGGTNNLSWINNKMSNNAYGYILDDYIGPQPFPYFTSSSHPYTTGNQWLPGGGLFTWNSLGASPNYQTYLRNVISIPITDFPTGSPMNVKDATFNEDPCFNGGDIPSPPVAFYGGGYVSCIGNGTYVNTDPHANECPFVEVPHSTVPPSFMPVHASTKTMPFDLDTHQKDWIAQNLVYKMFKNVDSTGDSTGTIDTFMVMARTRSRYMILDSIEQLISNGNYTDASLLLSIPMNLFVNTDSNATTGAVMADDTSADGVVNNYIEYYKLLIKYKTSVLNTTDSNTVIAMANKCPFIDGSIIYQFRTFYSKLYNDTRLFSDIGCVGKACWTGKARLERLLSEKKKTVQVNNQQYSLYPNPNDGSFTLQQLITDNSTVEIDVLNSLGISVYKGQSTFEGGINKLNIGKLVPGLYLLHLRDNTGTLYTQTFVIDY